jgi:hypothetical protein
MKKIWIASFPRSGNTFFRNILFDVYGLDSLEDESEMNLSKNKNESVFIKVHKLPYQLNSYHSQKDIVIYLVRDGRDSICSMAYKRKSLIDPNSDIHQNFCEAVHAQRGSFFGGWANNCRLWLSEDTILVRFEDLIKDPQQVFSTFEKHIGLPSGNWDNLPTFEKQKQGLVKHGVDQPEYNYKGEDFSQKFFRKGQVGNWKEEMPKEFQQIFWCKSKEIMLALGYSEDGTIGEINNNDLKRIKAEKIKNFNLKLKLKIGAFQIKYFEMKKRLKKLAKE